MSSCVRRAATRAPRPACPGFATAVRPPTAPDAIFGRDPRHATPHAHALLTSSAIETELLGHELGARALPGTCVLLKGSLGVGKTVFARGFVRGATGTSVAVPSPSFLLDNTYTAKSGCAIHHVDAYRLHSAEDAAVLGLPALLGRDIVIVEWPQRIAGSLPREYLLVRIASELDGGTRFPSAWRNALVAASALDDVLAGSGAHGGHTPVHMPSTGSAAGVPGAADRESARDARALTDDSGRRAVMLYPLGARYEAMVAGVGADLPRVDLQ